MARGSVIKSVKSGSQIWPIDGGTPTPLPGLGPRDRVIQWSGDGRVLYLRTGGALPAELERYEIATGRKEAWKKLEPVDLAGVDGIGMILVSSDGKHYAYSYGTTTKSDLYVIDGLQARLW